MRHPAGFDGEWRARFQRFGARHATEHAVSGWSPEGLERRVRLFARLLDRHLLSGPGRALELGCGAGTYVRYLASRGYRAVGVDYAVSSLGRAAERDAAGVGVYVAADGYELPFAPASFDLVVCIGVLQALGHPERLLDEIARVVRPGGMLVLEALNAFAVHAVLRRIRDAVTRRAPAVRVDAVFQVQAGLRARGLEVRERLGVYLPPPHRLRVLRRVLDRPWVAPLLDATPGAGLASAHAFWLVARRAAEGEAKVDGTVSR